MRELSYVGEIAVYPYNVAFAYLFLLSYAEVYPTTTVNAHLMLFNARGKEWKLDSRRLQLLVMTRTSALLMMEEVHRLTRFDS
jgi:hypothetical protein